MLSFAQPEASRASTALSIHSSECFWISTASCSCHLDMPSSQSLDSEEWAICAPWMRVVLRKFELMLGNNVCVLIENDKAHGSVLCQPMDDLSKQERTHVVPQSSEPTNSPSFNILIKKKGESIMSRKAGERIYMVAKREAECGAATGC